jgi:hypothetical protein
MYRILFISLILLETISLWGQTPADPGPGDSVKPVTMADLQRDYEMDIQQTKQFATFGIPQMAEDSRNPFQAARVVEFDAKATNFERYRTSPCFNTLGFSPFMDSAKQASKYVECEKVYYAKFRNKILVYGLIILAITAIVFVGTRKH